MMELLTVIAILAVLVAIIIPVFSGYLEKSREAVDLANVRSAYSEVAVAVSVGDTARAVKVVSLMRTRPAGRAQTPLPSPVAPTPTPRGTPNTGRVTPWPVGSARCRSA